MYRRVEEDGEYPAGKGTGYTAIVTISVQVGVPGRLPGISSRLTLQVTIFLECFQSDPL